MERPESEDLLFQILEDRPIHARPELFRALTVASVVRESAARRLERTRVEDELAGGPSAAGLGGGD